MQGEGGGLKGAATNERSTVITKILNFSPNRALKFSPSRDLSFESNRTLGFDPSRSLSFDSWRQLPFGQAGVFFRGYICPSCRRLALPGTRNCLWCKATFDEPMFYIREDIAKDIREWQDNTSISTCPSCGLRNPGDAKFCIECGLSMNAEAKQPIRQAPSARTATSPKKLTAKKRARVRVVS